MSVKGIMKQLGGYHGIEKSGTVVNTSQTSAENVISTPQKAVKVELENKNTDSQSKDNNGEYKAIKNAIDEINKKLKPTRTGCEFTYNDKVNRVSIKVINKDTDEIIKEIPPEEAFKALEKVWEVAGLLVDEKL